MLAWGSKGMMAFSKHFRSLYSQQKGSHMQVLPVMKDFSFSKIARPIQVSRQWIQCISRPLKKFPSLTLSVDHLLASDSKAQTFLLFRSVNGFHPRIRVLCCGMDPSPGSMEQFEMRKGGESKQKLGGQNGLTVVYSHFCMFCPIKTVQQCNTDRSSWGGWEMHIQQVLTCRLLESLIRYTFQ